MGQKQTVRELVERFSMAGSLQCGMLTQEDWTVDTLEAKTTPEEQLKQEVNHSWMGKTFRSKPGVKPPETLRTGFVVD